MPFADVAPHFSKSAGDIHVSGDKCFYTSRVLADGFSHGIFDVSYPGPGKCSVNINTNYGNVIHDDTVSALYTGNSAGQLLKMVFERNIAYIPSVIRLSGL
ncbi:hypothetical protein D3C73_1356020 [compost metagenome]